MQPRQAKSTTVVCVKILSKLHTLKVILDKCGHMLDEECDLSTEGFEVYCPGSFHDHEPLSYRFL